MTQLNMQVLLSITCHKNIDHYRSLSETSVVNSSFVFSVPQHFINWVFFYLQVEKVIKQLCSGQPTQMT